MPQNANKNGTLYRMVMPDHTWPLGAEIQGPAVSAKVMTSMTNILGPMKKTEALNCKHDFQRKP